MKVTTNFATVLWWCLLVCWLGVCAGQDSNATDTNGTAPAGPVIPPGPCGQLEFDYLGCKNSSADTQYCLPCFDTLKTQGFDAAYPRPDECFLAQEAYCVGIIAAASDNIQCVNCFDRSFGDLCSDRFNRYWTCMVATNWDIIAANCDPEENCNIPEAPPPPPPEASGGVANNIPSANLFMTGGLLLFLGAVAL